MVWCEGNDFFCSEFVPIMERCRELVTLDSGVGRVWEGGCVGLLQHPNGVGFILLSCSRPGKFG